MIVAQSERQGGATLRILKTDVAGVATVTQNELVV